jgi:hypothetical protein
MRQGLLYFPSFFSTSLYVLQRGFYKKNPLRIQFFHFLFSSVKTKSDQEKQSEFPTEMDRDECWPSDTLQALE